MPLSAQDSTNKASLPIEIFGIKDGLSQGLVSGILQDKEGFLWFSTKDGLNRYDGYQIKIFRHDNNDPYSLPDNYITELFEDDQGRIWIGTYSKGVCVFNKKQNRFYRLKLPQDVQDENAYVRHLKYRNGAMYLTRNNLLIYNIKNVSNEDIERNNLQKTPVLFNYNSLFKKNYFTKIIDPYTFINNFWLWKKNEFWLTCKDSFYHYQIGPNNSIIRLNAYSSEYFHFNNSVVQFSISEGVHHDQEMILSGNNKIIVYDLQKEKIIHEYTSNMKNNFLPTIVITDDQYLFVGEINSVLFNPYTFEINIIDKSNLLLNSDKLTGECFMRDRNSIQWIGTSGHGIYKIDQRKLQFDTDKSKRYNFFKHNPEGDFLGRGYTSKQPVLYDFKQRKEYPLFSSNFWKSNWELYDINCDKEGNYFILFYMNDEKKINILTYNRTTKKLIRREVDYVPSTLWNSLLLDSRDELWLHYVTDKSSPVLKRIDKKTFLPKATYFFPAEKETRGYPFISSYFMDQHHIWWFATIQGLFRFDESKNEWKQWKHIPGDSTSISDNLLFSLCADPFEPNRYLWLGTNGEGLNRFDQTTGKCIQYSITDGLPNQVIYSIEHDDDGNLWMGTNKGLSCFHIKKNKFKNYTVADGLFGDEFNRYNNMRLQNGNLFFGGVDGTVLFNPKHLNRKGIPPSIMLTELSILNKPFDFRTDTSIMSSPITYAKSITLPPEKGMFSITYSALEYTSSTAKKYKYYLEGFDKTWIDAGIKNEATYNNLSPGTYTFHVIGAGLDDVWNTKGASIIITMLPAWWQTWWFRSFIVICIGSILYGLYKYRLNQAIQLISIRNRIAGDLHDEIGSTLSSISMSSMVIKEKLKNASPEVESLLSQVVQNTSAMMESLSDIVWTINTKNETFENVIHRMRAFGSDILEAKDIKLSFDVQDECDALSLTMQQRKNIYLICKEAINNAAKYANCKNVFVSIQLHNMHTVVMKIQDDGIGFDSMKSTSERLGGNGLVNMRKRTEELQGQFEVITALNQGTCIKVLIPI